MKTLVLAMMVVFAASTTQANEFEGSIKDYLDQQISGWANDPVLVGAIQSQNNETQSFDQAQIDALDQTWRGFAGMADADIISGVINNPAAEFLRSKMNAADGIITEAFVMDARGLNVAAAAPTSDYWQGDEAKFTETFPKGAGAVHIGEMEIDGSTQEVQSQVSVALVDPQTGQAIGALTVGISLTAMTSQLN